MFERVVSLIGEENLEKIASKTVLIVGLGGVGGYAVEGLVRSGIRNFILVDYDTVDISNLNRQVIALQENLGAYKTDVVEKRILDIHPGCSVKKFCMKLDLNNIERLFQEKFDYCVDACDTIVIKQELIRRCLERKIRIISSMGTGNKMNPMDLQIVDIRDTSYDPIAKRIRKYLKDNHIYDKVPVVYSKEQGEHFEGDIPSMIFVPAVSGLLCANFVIKDIINLK